jgi:hypothetical protein
MCIVLIEIIVGGGMVLKSKIVFGILMIVIGQDSASHPALIGNYPKQHDHDNLD